MDDVPLLPFGVIALVCQCILMGINAANQQQTKKHSNTLFSDSNVNRQQATSDVTSHHAAVTYRWTLGPHDTPSRSLGKGATEGHN